MQIEFIANASFKLTLASGKVLLTDPWYADGVYYGTWLNFPPLAPARRAEVEAIRPDWIYISHIHPDHLDPVSLTVYPRETPILIGRLPEPALTHLHRAIGALGFEDVRIFDFWSRQPLDGGGEFAILPQFAASNAGHADHTGYEIDTSIWLRDADGTSVFNGVDNALHDDAAREVCDRFGRPDVAILPYAGGSFFPQGCPAYSHETKLAWRDRIGARRLGDFIRHAEIVGARWTGPAAGSYVLGGRVAPFSQYLHQATPPEIAAAWEEAPFAGALELCHMASGDVIDVAAGAVVRNEAALFRSYTPAERHAFANSRASDPLPHDAVQVPDAFAIDWNRLIGKAAKTLAGAAAGMNLDIAYDIEIVVQPNTIASTPAEGVTYRFALDNGTPPPEGRRFIRFGMDDGMMLMVLLGAANWNNVEIASLLTCERVPDTQDPSIHKLMNSFKL